MGMYDDSSHSVNFKHSPYDPMQALRLGGAGVLGAALATETGRDAIKQVTRSTSNYLEQNPGVGVGLLVAGGLFYLICKAMDTESSLEIPGLLKVEPGKR